MSVYLHLYHGRKTVDESLEDWGFDGPLIGPLENLHVTYLTHLRATFSSRDHKNSFFITCLPDERRDTDLEMDVPIKADCIHFNGEFFGDFYVVQMNIKTARVHNLQYAKERAIRRHTPAS